MLNVNKAKSNLKTLFPECEVRVIKTVHKDRPALDAELTGTSNPLVVDEYDGGILSLLTDVAKAMGCSELDLSSQYKTDGCESCDFGAKYHLTFTGWDK